MEKKIKLDPFAYGKWDVATTIIQIATAIVGVVLALNGNTAGLLALGSLAGGVKGNLLSDLLRAAGNDLNKPKRPGPILFALVVVLGVVLLSGCGAINKQFLLDSRKAIAAEAGDYLMGCSQATIAPSFSVDWNENVTYGGGLFAGCAENGRIVEFRCEAYLDDETGKTRMKCAPLSLWKREDDGK
jgi:hypothetical protein